MSEEVQDKNLIDYQRFINLVDKLEASPDFSGLKPLDMALLKKILKFYIGEKSLNVGQILKWKEEGSAATIHARLMRLKSHQLINFRISKTRKKMVTPTDLVINKFKELGSRFIDECLI